jgi:hypothetical protein
MTFTGEPANPLAEVVEDSKAEAPKRGRPRKPSPGNRLHIFIPEGLANRMVEIQKDTHAASLTEVVKNALTLYAAAVEEHKAGGFLYLKRGTGGIERQLALFI